MPRIVDEFTNRKDMTKSQKYWARHPELKDKHAADMRAWRDKNPDAADAIQNRWKNKKRRESVLKRAFSRASYSKSEILRLHARGKTIADIVVWTGAPYSAVASIILGNQVQRI